MQVVLLEMKKLSQNKLFKNYLSLVIPLLILELLFKYFLEMPLMDWSFFRIFLSTNILSLFLSLLFSYLPDKLNSFLTTIILFIASVYAILQAGFQNYLGVFISLGTSSQLGAVTEYIKDYFDSFNPWFYTMIIPFILYLVYKFILEKRLFKAYYFYKNHPLTKKINNWTRVIYVILIILGSIFYYQTLTLAFMQNELQLEPTKSLFKNPTNPNISVNQFGISVFGLLDVKTTLIKPEEDIVIDEESPIEPVEEVPQNLERTIDDTAWKLLNENTTNKDYQTLNNYFMNRTITPKNEYTGMFKGKNLIIVMMESVDEIFINEKYFPTFYKLYTEGYSFSNAYSPRNSCSTANNEMSGMISLFSVYRSCTANKYRKNTYFESIFNLFNKAGYETSSYHNFNQNYYYRNTIHKNMGSGAYYGADELNIPYVVNPYEEWPSDIELVEKAMTKIDTSKPFMAWMTTVSSHQPYYLSSTLGDKHLSLFTDTNYSLNVKRYMSKLKELDLALARLLEILENEGILKDTVIVLYGDHYPYGLSNSDINTVLPYNVNEKNNVDKTPFVIYNQELVGKNFTEYTSYMNILPTIANLFDLDYDPRLYVGEDILNPSYTTSYKNRVIFADGSWENDKAVYNATTGKVKYLTDFKYTNEEIIKYNKEISNMIKMSNLAITTNYFAYLNEGLAKYNN